MGGNIFEREEREKTNLLLFIYKAVQREEQSVFP
jgi:hypothetical protein